VNEQPLNLGASLREIWRRRLLVIVVAALCGLGGLAYGLLRPANQTAVALVLLPPSATSSSGSPGNSGNTGNTGTVGNDIATEADIAKSTPVLAAAGAKLRPPLGALGVEKLVTVTPLSGQILQIQAQAAASRYAVQVANAVAASYVDYIGHLEADSANAAVAALRHESSQLTQQINDLQSEINTVTARIASEAAGSSQAQQDTNLLGSLRSEQNQVSQQLNSVTNQITNAQIENDSKANTTRIIQTATAQPNSKYAFPIEAGIIAFAFGALGGAVFVLVRIQHVHRLRFRDEIARTAGAPIIASIDAPSCTTVSAWRNLLAGGPRAATEWSLRHLLDSLPNSGRSRRTVRVISFAGDSAALATGPRLALHAATSGISTVLVAEAPRESEDRSLTSLWAAINSGEPVTRGLPLTFGLNGQAPPDLIVSLVVFHGNSTVLTPSDAVNLLSISANVVTDEELARLALQAADSELVLEGVVVVNPDPNDNTTGFMRKDTVQDTVRLLPSRVGADGSGHELVQLAGMTSEASSSRGRPSRRET
jgi:capsular polysaccharide biosynthesis protein